MSKTVPIEIQGVAITEISESKTPPRLEGRYKAIAVCWVLGLGTLFAWNSVVTIGDYYYTLFPKYHPSRVLTLVYQPFALIAMAALAYNEAKVNTRKRILAGYTIFFLGTLMLIVVDLATSGSGGIGPYIGICAINGALGVAGAHVEGGIVGDLSFMCPEFIQSFLSGLAAAGALTSVLRLITKAVFDKYNNGFRKGAMLFLSISTFIQFVCILLYAIYFPRLPIVKYYRSKAASEGSKTVSADLATAGIQTKADIEVQNGAALPQRLRNKQLFNQNLDYGLGLLLTYALTLSIFPGFLYENTQNHKLGSWYPLVLIAVYNAADLTSRYIPLVKCLKMESRKGLMIAILLRMLFVPAFYFTAKYGDLGWMMMLTSLLGFSNGYFTVCVMIVAPKGYQGSEQNALGNLLVLWLFFGVFAGLSINWLWLAH
ncbi:equilibrative nucleotide transporter 3 [Rosa chinensis]|uniref:equilibrative nucleotide transporter 3 n=1 Tax=Rosa chinensis TaxID=74649 RepID=UPI001AD8A3BE|nr:equilibrative nucleotide transporter 3 [Rosa chinensis]